MSAARKAKQNNGICKTLSKKQNKATDNEEYGWEEEGNKINQNMKHIFLLKTFKQNFTILMRSELYQNSSMSAEKVEIWDQILYVNQGKHYKHITYKHT